VIAIRPFEPNDLEPVVALLKETLAADPMTSEVFQRKVLLDPNFEPAGALVAEENGIVGFALGIMRKLPIENQVPDFDRGWITLIAVAPEKQRQGIGSELLGRMHAYHETGNVKSVWVSPYAPNYFAPGVDVNAYTGAVGFFKKNGFVEAYRPLSMDASLLGLKTPDWVSQKERVLKPDGVKVEQFEPHMTLPLLAFMKKEFPGDWQRYIRESLTAITQGRFRRDQVWVARNGDKVLGFAQHEAERFGPFGVAPSERGRGIGAVLLFKCLEAMRDNGLHNAWFLWTDDKTARLYKEAGFSETRRYVVMKKVLE
jgi:mycothiol synthase